MGFQPPHSADNVELRPSRTRRWVKTVLRVVGGLALAVVVVAWAAVLYLQSDRGRASLVDMARRRGLTVDYERLSLQPVRGRLAIEGIRFAMPEAHEVVGDEWLRIGRLELSWSPWALLGAHLYVRQLEIEGVRLHVVIDDEGRDSISLAFEGLAGEPDDAPERPLSQRLSGLELPMGLTLDRLRVYDVRATLSEGLEPGSGRRLVADGVELDGSLRLHDAPLQAELRLGSADDRSATRLTILEADASASEMDLRWSTRLAVREGSTVELDASAELLRQTLSPSLPSSGPVLDARVTVELLPEEGLVRLELERLHLLDEVTRATVRMTWVDGERIPRFEGGAGSFTVDPLVPLLSDVQRTFVSEGVRGEFRVETDDAPGSARLSVRAEIERLGRRTPNGSLSVESASLTAEAAIADDVLDVALVVPIERLVTTSDNETLIADEVVLELATRDLRLGTSDVLETTGRIEVLARAHALEGRTAAGRLDVRGPRVKLDAALRREGEGAELRPGLGVGLEDATLALDSGLTLQLGQTRLDLELTGHSDDLTHAGPVALVGTGTVERLHAVTATREGVELDGMRLELDATVDRASASAARAEARVDALRAYAGGSTLRVHEVGLRLGLDRVELDVEDDPTVRTALVSAELEGKRVSMRGRDLALATDTMGVALTGRYRLRGSSTLEGALRLGALRLAKTQDGWETLTSAGEIAWRATELVLDPARPLRSRGTLHATGRLAPFRIDLEGRLAQGEVDADLQVRVDALGRSWAAITPADPQVLDLSRAGLDLRAKAAWRGLESATVKLDHHVEVAISDIGTSLQGVRAELPRVELVFDHRRSEQDHIGEVRARVIDPVVNDLPIAGSFMVDAELELDDRGGMQRLRSTLSGPQSWGLHADLSADLRDPEVVRHTERLAVAHVDRLIAAVPELARHARDLELADTSIELEGEGTIGGRRQAGLELNQHASVTVRGLRYAPEGLLVALPQMRVELEATGTSEALSTKARLDLPRVDIEDRQYHLTLHEAKQQLDITVVGLDATPSVSVDVDGRIARVEQDVWSVYPMEDLSLTGRLLVEGPGHVELDRFVIENALGGTRLELHKQLGELGRARAGDTARATRGRHLALRGRIVQDLARLDAAPHLLRARGRVTAPFRVDSGDGTLFRLQGRVNLEGVDVTLPERDLSFEGARASISVEEAIEWTPETGIVVVPHTDRNAFSRVRFQDIQPFLSKDNHVRVERLRWNAREAGPLVGSLRVERNVFSLDKLELEKGEARISGQLVLDYMPGAERLAFRGKVTGLRPGGSKQPIDANAAIVFDPSRLELDGRMQIVQISRKHLLDLLDLVDPYREEAALATLRRRLGYGYPKRVSIALSQGLMSMQVELGGLVGSMLKVGEIRGVPMGPFVNRHVAPLVPW